MFLGFIITCSVSFALIYMAPNSLPEFFTKEGIQKFKAKIQGKYSKDKMKNFDYIEGYEDFEPTTTVSDYAENVKDSSGANQDIKEYSNYAKRVKETTDNIIDKVEKGEFGKLIDKSGDSMKAYMEMVKNKAKYYMNSDNVSEEDKQKLQKQLRQLEKKDMSSSQ